MPDITWKALLQQVGKNVEETGRMLKRKPAFTDEDLRCLQDALTHNARTVRTIRQCAAKDV